MNIAVRRARVPDPQSMALQIAAGRAVIGAVILADPVRAARMLGADTATAQRASWLTRMLGVRDSAIGVGGVAAVRQGSGAASWILAGAVADALDAVVLAGALKNGRVKGLGPAATVPFAAGAAVLGAATALRLRRR
jgi:hypothetical protein